MRLRSQKRMGTSKSLTLTKAFAHYSARLKNVRWAYSAISADDKLIVACWSRYLKDQPDGREHYQVNDLSQWTSNPLGKKLLQQHLKQALDAKLRVRMVRVNTADHDAPIAGVDGSKLAKTIHVADEMIGRVIQATPQGFTIEFKREGNPY